MRNWRFVLATVIASLGLAACGDGLSDGQLAIAFFDGGDSGGFDDAEDTLIAELVDGATDDGVLSVGDEIRTYSYPRDFEGTDFGDFTVTRHVVDTVLSVTDSSCTALAGEHRFTFSDGPHSQMYAEWPGPVTGPRSALLDAVSEQFSDWIQLNPTSPSAPPDSIDQINQGASDDDSFVDVVTSCS